jgi:cell wall-associated NlpC family hydrolase
MPGIIYLYKPFIAVILLTVLFISGCSSFREIKQSPQYRSPVIAYALSLQGVPYRYGKESPQEGFDCSGFVKHVYEQHGIYLPRTTKEMAATLPSISKNNLQSGDLIFFNTNGKPHSHVGIYIDNYDFIHAPSQRTGRVLVSSLKNRYWRKHFTAIRRPGRYQISKR